MSCPHLDYRESDGENEFEVARAYCTVVDEFVQPMRADVCNDRYALEHESHCEIFLEQAADGGTDESTDEDAADGPGSR